MRQCAEHDYEVIYLDKSTRESSPSVLISAPVQIGVPRLVDCSSCIKYSQCDMVYDVDSGSTALFPVEIILEEQCADHIIPQAYVNRQFAHPNIADNGYICVGGDTDDADWNTSLWLYLIHIMHVIQHPNFDDPLTQSKPCKDMDEYIKQFPRTQRF